MPDATRPIFIDRCCDVCFSPDEGGWYLTRWAADDDANEETDEHLDAVSQIFPTEGEARDAYAAGTVEWVTR